MLRPCALFVFVLLVLSALPHSAIGGEAVRIGYFANITHAQALVGKANGTFEKKVGSKIDWKIFNAGPTAMEALLSGAIDIAYVGPNPALNAYVRSGGKALRIIAGAASGGASLVVQKDGVIRTVSDLKGKRVATPEFGNTQDIALRHWLKEKGMKPGSDLQVMPVKNAEILDLFMQKKIAAAWVPEPWVSRLIYEADGRIFLDERNLWPGGKFPTAVLVVRAEYLAGNREVVRRILEAHLEATEWINAQPGKARKLVNAELAKVTRKPMSDAVINDAFSRLFITYDPSRQALMTSAARARDLGFLPKSDKAPLEGILDLTLLNQVLAGKRMKPVK
ncbi:MAG TPA: ABC transporter substrate-binding protein [Geobacteraceae bacterium]|nr:ABC transporter substrate-binding protein [Geobacteraceae bacterium]